MMVIEKLKSKLEESEARYRRLFETARDGILILNSTTGQITDVNPFLEQLLGYSKKELLGKKLWEVGAFTNIKAAQEYFRSLKETGYIRYENLPLEAKDGRQIEVEFVSNIYMAGDVRVIQCNIRDISERKRFEAGVEVQRLLEVEKSKAVFIADATHELRTPLAIIKGNVDLGLRASVTNYKSARRALVAINKEIEHLSELLSDLTMLTMRDNHFHKKTTDFSPERKISLKDVNLLAVIKSVVKRSKTLADKKKISINLSKVIPSVVVSGDSIYLEKLFINIINNALIYGKQKGKVVITGVKDDGEISITVTDNGIGIGKEDLPYVFNRFYRAEAARTKSAGGTGLGLAISKWIVEAHGGTIDVESSIHKGTVFTICLPITNITSK